MYFPSGETETFYAGLQAVSNAKAPGSLQAITGIIDNIVYHWKDKLIAICTDGASVMIGRKGSCNLAIAASSLCSS